MKKSLNICVWFAITDIFIMGGKFIGTDNHYSICFEKTATLCSCRHSNVNEPFPESNQFLFFVMNMM